MLLIEKPFVVDIDPKITNFLHFRGTTLFLTGSTFDFASASVSVAATAAASGCHGGD